jgi:hypothetical protein
MTERTEKTVHLSTEGEVGELLCALYRDIWIEAHYDPDNERTEKYAKKLLPAIQRLNKILKFKR